MVGPIYDVLLLVNDVNVGYDILHINIHILMYPHGRMEITIIILLLFIYNIYISYMYFFHICSL